MALWVIILGSISAIMLSQAKVGLRMTLQPSNSGYNIQTNVYTNPARSVVECALMCQDSLGSECRGIVYTHTLKLCRAFSTGPTLSPSRSSGSVTYQVSPYCGGAYQLYNNISNTCMELSTTTVSWSLAKAQCAVSGGHLLSVESRQLTDFVMGGMNSAASGFPAEWQTVGNVWISAYSPSGDGIFSWHGRITSTIVEHLWHSGHSMDVNAHCIYLTKLGWDAHSTCDVARHYVCEFPL